MNGNTFYDIHMHAFNLNYQYIRAYLTRLDLLVIAAGAFFTIGRLGLPAIPLMHFFGKKLKKARNMLALMENDLGEFFLQTEYCLKSRAIWLKKSAGRCQCAPTAANISPFAALTPRFNATGVMRSGFETSRTRPSRSEQSVTILGVASSDSPSATMISKSPA